MEKQKLIEENKELHRQVAFLEKRYEMLFTSIDCAIWEYDRNTHLVHHEKKLPGKYENENLDIPDYRNTIKGWGIIHPDDMMVFEEYCDSMDRGEESFRYDFRTLRDDNTYSWQRVEGNTVRDMDGNIIKIIGKTYNVEQEYRDREDLRMRSCTDSLTGLLNKGAFYDELNRVIVNGRLEKNPKFHAIYIMDIDNFKGINDNYGHLFGDYVLEEYANQVKYVFDKHSVVGRIGGDEFAVIKKDVSNREEVENYAKKLNKLVRELELERDAHITTSIGIALFPMDANEKDDIFQAADAALYDVKEHGKDGYAFYNEMYPMEKKIDNRRQERKNRIPQEYEISDVQYLELKKQLEELLDENYYYKKLMGNAFSYYVVENYRLVLSGKEKIKNCLCYEQYGLTRPCDDCPIQYMNNHEKRYSVENYDSSTGKWYCRMAVRVKGKNGNEQYVIAKEDITHFMDKSVERDMITGLMTYSCFERHGMKLLSRSKDMYCMVYIGYKDLDGLCRQFGYKVRHEIIKITARHMEYSLAEGELVAGIQDGDFILLLKREPSVFDRVHMMMKVLQHKCELNYPGCFSYMEAGVYYIKDDFIPLVMSIDYAGYAKKYAWPRKFIGDNEFVLFDENLEKQFKRDEWICQNMYQALLEDKYQIRFLPVVVPEGRGSSVLLKSVWKISDDSILDEEEYISIFKERSFLSEFYLYICEKAFSYFDKWKEKKPPIICLKCDIVGDWDRSFYDKLDNLMKEYHIDKNQLQLILEDSFETEQNGKTLTPDELEQLL
ncbi:MAG: diguanylate cyclase domain-containing protein [Lachnospiraceae bacterium]